MGIAEWWRSHRAEQIQTETPDLPSDIISSRLRHIEDRLKAMGVRVERIEDDMDGRDRKEGSG